MTGHREALARTTLLLNQEWFSGDADEDAIADALLATTVRLAAGTEALACRAGQTAFFTSVLLTARLGIGIELDAPNVRVIDAVAPLRTPSVVDALLELGRDLIPGATMRTSRGNVENTFGFGRVESSEASLVRVGATNLTAAVARGSLPLALKGNDPLGGFAAGTAVAALALQAALARIEEAVGLNARVPRPSPGPPVVIDLRQLYPELELGLLKDLGEVDAISGGAITHALLFCLLRVEGLNARVRVVEEQLCELSNMNRYALLRASDAGRAKTEQLESVASAGLEIRGVSALFTKETREIILPFADRVVVGVDDVEARWWIQEENPDWLAVGATGNHLAEVTTHGPETACAACLHPVPLPPQTIPSISFVSFWAGLMQVCALLSQAPAGHRSLVYPFALASISGFQVFSTAPNSTCPIGCRASQSGAADRS